jgi:hypothetical protein
LRAGAGEGLLPGSQLRLRRLISFLLPEVTLVSTLRRLDRFDRAAFFSLRHLVVSHGRQTVGQPR